MNRTDHRMRAQRLAKAALESPHRFPLAHGVPLRFAEAYPAWTSSSR
jgi:hypothetical protein